MSKNFYFTTDISVFTPELKERLIDLSSSEYNNYLCNLPSTEQFKYDIFKRHKLYMSTLMLKYSTFKVYEGDTERDLFNFYFDLPTSKSLCRSPVLKKYLDETPLRTINDLPHCAIYFEKTLNLLNEMFGENLHSCYYMLYHKGCEVLPHTHSPGIRVLHILLQDIEGGDFIVGVGNEEKVITKRGQDFMFDPDIVHYARFEGDYAIFLMINIPTEAFNKYINT